METDKVRDARKNEVGYCGDYCRTCQKPFRSCIADQCGLNAECSVRT